LGNEINIVRHFVFDLVAGKAPGVITRAYDLVLVNFWLIKALLLPNFGMMITRVYDLVDFRYTRV
jgi:hypothetical protein